jgi:hypothetical protein
MTKHLLADVAAVVLISGASAQTFPSYPPAPPVAPQAPVPGSSTTTTTTVAPTPGGDYRTTTTKKGVDANGNEVTKKARCCRICCTAMRPGYGVIRLTAASGR